MGFKPAKSCKKERETARERQAGTETERER